MSDTAPQRHWRAACPNCGAAVEFRSAASASAVCSFCRSTLVREGEALRRIGQSAELFDDHSPLRLGAAGRWQGEGFALVGRLQIGWADGRWNEWHALFDNGKSGWLSEDNGRYVLAFDLPEARDLPTAEGLLAGAQRLVDGSSWSVASVTRARLLAAEGELPQPPGESGAASAEFTVADLRNERDEVGTLDYRRPGAPLWSVGRGVRLAELAMSGLAEASEKTLASRSLDCPNCGTALTPRLDSTQSIVCPSCKAVVDLSAKLGDGYAHYVQQEGQGHLEPLIPLGTMGLIALGAPGANAQALPWQVVGYAEHCEIAEHDGDEQSLWREYLLYHRSEGFAFLVDAEDGWSWAVPLTGAPRATGDVATWQGQRFRKRYSYTAQITWVLGEFYWQLRRGERTFHTDYATGANRLNREQTGAEITWSAGRTLEAEQVRQAFRLASDQAPALRRDASPLITGGGAGLSLGQVLRALMWFALIVLVIVLLFRCGSDDCDDIGRAFGAASAEYQQCRRSGGGSGLSNSSRGGSFGGFSSGGGGHK